MNPAKLSLLIIFAALLTVAGAQTHRADAPPASGPAMTLEQLEQMAMERNPTLKQADAQVRAAAGRARQAGLYPNPIVSYRGEEIRGGASRGGEQGGFLQQEIVLGGKLGAQRRVMEQEQRQAEAEREEQRLRVQNNVRLAFYQSLAAQEMVRLHGELEKIAVDGAATARRLYNIGQAERTDVLEAEVESEKEALALIEARETQKSRRRALAAVVGNPQLETAQLQGDLEAVPDLDSAEWQEKLARESPAVKIAQIGVARAEAEATRAGKEPMPDLQLRGGLEQNNELRDSSGKPVGMQGFAEIGVRIPLFNRNQGNVAAAKADVDRANMEMRRVELLLRERAAATAEGYESARAAVERYRKGIIPRSEEAYKLTQEKYRGIAASYPQVLMAERSLFRLRIGYVAALERMWGSSIALQGYLLTDGLEAPAAPGEIDRPVRETNLPMHSAMPAQR